METETCCLFAIDFLYAHLFKTDTFYEIKTVDLEYPMFVTWKTTNDHVLRGCIGTTSPINLIKGLKKYSLCSALEDGRFSPVKATELENLACTISLLTDFEDCSSSDDWIIGIHGISIKFEHQDQVYRALYLPEVMTEHGFDHKSALFSLIKKSGLSRSVDEKFFERLQIKRFQSQKSSVTVASYIRIRNQTH